MLYNELIEEVTRRVENLKPTNTIGYNFSFSEKLATWLEDFEHDILITKSGTSEVLSVEFLADAAFDKALDEELTGEAIYKSGWVDE